MQRPRKSGYSGMHSVLPDRSCRDAWACGDEEFVIECNDTEVVVADITSGSDKDCLPGGCTGWPMDYEHYFRTCLWKSSRCAPGKPADGGYMDCSLALCNWIRSHGCHCIPGNDR